MGDSAARARSLSLRRERSSSQDVDHRGYEGVKKGLQSDRQKQRVQAAYTNQRRLRPELLRKRKRGAASTICKPAKAGQVIGLCARSAPAASGAGTTASRLLRASRSAKEPARAQQSFATHLPSGDAARASPIRAPHGLPKASAGMCRKAKVKLTGTME